MEGRDRAVLSGWVQAPSRPCPHPSACRGGCQGAWPQGWPGRRTAGCRQAPARHHPPAGAAPPPARARPTPRRRPKAGGPRPPPPAPPSPPSPLAHRPAPLPKGRQRGGGASCCADWERRCRHDPLLRWRQAAGQAGAANATQPATHPACQPPPHPRLTHLLLALLLRLLLLVGCCGCLAGESSRRRCSGALPLRRKAATGRPPPPPPAAAGRLAGAGSPSMHADAQLGRPEARRRAQQHARRPSPSPAAWWQARLGSPSCQSDGWRCSGGGIAAGRSTAAQRGRSAGATVPQQMQDWHCLTQQKASACAASCSSLPCRMGASCRADALSPWQVHMHAKTL